MNEAQPVYADDEIELIDLIRTIWRWKWLIIVGTLLCMLAAGVISFLLPKVYRVSMVIRPGIVATNDNGHSIYIDTDQNIKAIIEAGTFDHRILKHLSDRYPSTRINKIKWQVSLPRDTNTIKVSYETDAADQGIFILNGLYQHLLTNYQPVVEQYKANYKLQIQGEQDKIETQKNDISRFNNEIASVASDKATAIEKVKNDIQIIQGNIASTKTQLANNQQRIAGIDKELDQVGKNTSDLIRDRNSFLKSAAKGNNALSAMIYSNTIQQNISYQDTLENQKISLLNGITKERAEIVRMLHEIKTDEATIENIKKQKDAQIQTFQSKIQDCKSKISLVQENIKHLEFRENGVQNIQKLQNPVRSFRAISPRVKLNIALAFIIGLVLMLIAVFFIDYIRRSGTAETMPEDSKDETPEDN